MLTLLTSYRRVLYNSHILYYTRILIALTGTTLVPWLLGLEPKVTIPLTLGVVAAALTDLDDRLTGRIKNLIITLFCFLIASVSIELLFPYPVLFFFGLAFSTCGFILLGALGQRYATIAFGALLIAIYTMLGVPIFDTWYIQPALLLTGAIWYNILTLIGHILFPVRPLQDAITQCYQQLSAYLDAKANLFDPDLEDDYQQSVYDLALVNSTLVSTMNQAKISLLSRLKGDRGQRGTRNTLQYYFVAQDIHERASSSHIQYQQLSRRLRHCDILFRFQRLLTMQARACQQVAQSVLWRKQYQHNPRFERTFTYIENSLQLLQQQSPELHEIKALRNLLKNLKGIDVQLKGLSLGQASWQQNNKQIEQLSDESVSGIRDVFARFKHHLTPKSSLFRHAIRMSVLLCTGYLIIQLFDLERGYWILLTSLFVCQPNYNATKRRLALRITGTLLGIAIGLPLLNIVPSIEGQLTLIVITGLLFFMFRSSQYAQATLFITLLVLFCFNLLGEGFEVALPRIIDTLIGCFIALLAVSFIWPDWKFRQLPQVVQKTMDSNCRYLDAILQQYYQGKDNSLEYRVARRDAHNNDAEFASIVSNMASDPKSYQITQEQAFRLLCLNHTLLGYISALGAHREQMQNEANLALLNDAICYIESSIQVTSLDPAIIDEKSERLRVSLLNRIDRASSDDDEKTVLIMEQTKLLVELIPEIKSMIKQISLS
ncbi:YccS family putative transporter [Providencia sp. PROV188]|nr:MULTISPECIES: YccS family putative transporter [Providencia]MTB44227.1 TIGR01666 family membrane protein [Providencia sp. wls1950]MTC43183.1 TIGR01666 family membrane protein [Providencia sp. wls1921]MTC46808.1 TIGR01666 family membrane protein [Providencia sp. wls1922]MBG5881582.1 TIGR01666 family membrane protein [Providencia alcalifaciens]MDR2242842.1 TIGR01666 family membrane protein [Providencia alcalifaciens]